MINVTQPYLPVYSEYEKYLKEIWQRNWLTNNGPCVQQLEKALKEFLGVKHLLFVNNGTIAIQIALKALAPAGEIITTPFSYVATTNSILWEGCRPVFADIKDSDFNIDPEKIIPLINERTTAILATHVYGNPCDTVAIEKIAEEHNLVVIYDAAHAFGTKYQAKALLSYGNVSTCSFHATKLFHTVEGGAIICNDDELADRMTLYRQFGHAGDDYFCIGINGKNSEVHAAMGLCILPSIDEIIADRKRTSGRYDELLKGLPIQRPVSLTGTEYNYSYYPVVFESEEMLLKVRAFLLENNINTRRYFFPSLNDLPHFKGEPCPVSESISRRVLALPMYYRVQQNDVTLICDCIKKCIG